MWEGAEVTNSGDGVMIWPEAEVRAAMVATDVAEKAHTEWLAHRNTVMSAPRNASGTKAANLVREHERQASAARRNALIDEQAAWGVVIAAIKRAWQENEAGT